MKPTNTKLKLLIATVTTGLALSMSAGTFIDNFSTSHNYLTQGAAGTAWQGMTFGIHNPGAVAAWNANVTASNSLTLNNMGGDLSDNGDGGATGDSPFMWQTVTGDFTNIVHVSDYHEAFWQIAGLEVRDPVSGAWLYHGYFELPFYGLTWDDRSFDATAVATTEVSGMPSYVDPLNANTFPKWLKIVRSGSVFTSSVSTNGVVWDDVNVVNNASIGTTVQVGIFDSTYNNQPCLAQFQNYSISGPNVNVATPPAQAWGLTLTTNLNGSYGLSWTAGSGSAGSVVIMRDGPVTYQPVSSSNYTANAAMGTGANVGEGNYVVYAGSGTAVTVTGLTAGDAYHVAVYSYSGSGAATVYNITNAPGAASPVQSLAVSATETNLVVGRQMVAQSLSQLTVLANYGNTNVNVTLDPGTVYGTSSATVATVNSAGLVSAHVVGTANITATFGGIVVTQQITVVAASSAAVNTSQLFVQATTDGFPTSGSITNWIANVPSGQVMPALGSPLPTVKDSGGAKYAACSFNAADGFRQGDYTGTAAIPVNGITIAAAVWPTTGNVYNDDRGEVLDVFYDVAGLAIRHSDGHILVARNIAYVWEESGCSVPFNTGTVVSLVVQADSSYLVFTNGVLGASVPAGDGGSMVTLTPGVDGTFANYINIGRNNGDTWSAFDGSIGDVYFYTNALSSTDRIAVEDALINKFITTATNKVTITATAGANGAISPSGGVSVLIGNSQTFTVTPNTGFIIQDVLVDGSSVGPISTYTVANALINHTIAASFTPAVSYTITASAGTGGTISSNGALSYIGSSTPNFVMTANTGYQIANVLVDGVSQGEISSYTFAPLAAGHTIAVSFASLGKSIPKSDQLIFGAVTDGFPHTNGAAIGDWPTLVPASGPATNVLTAINTPVVDIISGVNWELSDNANATGYRYGGSYTQSIPCSGASIVVAVKRATDNGTGVAWNSIVDVFYQGLVLGDWNSGTTPGGPMAGDVSVRRQGETTIDTGVFLPENQITVLSLVVQPNGNFVISTNGVTAYTNTTSASMTSLYPGAQAYMHYINVGRNNPDSWTTFNGAIGDVFLYKTALSDADRATLETYLINKFIKSATNIWTVTASAGANGSISPVGAASVNQGVDQSYTITPNAGYNIGSVLVDGVNVGAVTGWTFNAVNTNHVIAATFQSSTMATNPTNITYKVSGSTLTLTWPADHTGWILQSQTNSLSVGLGTNWVDVPGSSASNTNIITIYSTNPAVFYRMRLP